jgi:N,N-dimethylformamidase
VAAKVDRDATSPDKDAMHKLVGYCDGWSVKPGQPIRFMVSSAGDAPFDVRFVRHLCADPNPDGPGYRETAMPTQVDGTRPGRFQDAYLGSHGHAAGLAINPASGLAIGATIWPTMPTRGRQALVTLVTPQWRFCLGLDPNGVFAELTGADGATVRASCATPLLERRWYDVAAAFDAHGVLSVVQTPRRAVGTIRDGGAGGATGFVPPPAKADIWLAAMPSDTGAPHTAHFDGKLERPTIWRGESGIDEIVARQRGPVPKSDAKDLVACWDFAIDIPGITATDIGPAGAHAQLFNLPTRAMTGARWTGEVHDWKHAPAQYAAIHFHSDDQGDLGWAESFALDIPADWPSGFYAAHISNDAAEDYIPFFVRPLKPASDVVLLVPTYTYQIYGCYVRPGRGAEISGRVRAWGALPETPDMNPEFGLSTYNYHADGSGVSIASMRRPMLDTRPKQMSLMDPSPNGSGTGRIGCDSYIIDWLDHAGIGCDVVTDHDLHAEGADLLAPYRVVIAAQHPEYHSDRMMQALEDYLGGGGRLMYLGGNGFYWRAEPCEAAPHALEVRRAESGIRVWPTEAGENYHAHGGGYGGLWRRIGRPAHRLVGNGFSSQGRHLGFPYRFVDGIRDPRVAFMTEGLTVAPGEAFGEAGFMGGGAAGFELDSADPKFGTPPNALIVAKGVVIHPDYGPVNEDMLIIRHPRPQEDWSCADMVFFETPAGGAVFSVGSMTYVGGLPVDGYGSTLTRLTTNVLRRFLDPAPFL